MERAGLVATSPEASEAPVWLMMVAGQPWRRKHDTFRYPVTWKQNSLMASEENYVGIDKTLKELNIGGKVRVLVFLLVLLEKIIACSLPWV